MILRLGFTFFLTLNMVNLTLRVAVLALGVAAHVPGSPLHIANMQREAHAARHAHAVHTQMRSPVDLTSRDQSQSTISFANPKAKGTGIVADLYMPMP